MSAKIKGSAVISTLGIFRAVLAGSTFESLVESCPPETRQLLRRTLVAVEWVPLKVWTPFMQAVFAGPCHGDELQFRRLVRAVCKRDFTTAYRVYLNVATPELILSKMSSIWCGYFDSGSLSLGVTEIEGSRYKATVRMRDLETQFPLHVPILHGYLEQILLMAGAQQLVILRANEFSQYGKLHCDYLVQCNRTPQGPV